MRNGFYRSRGTVFVHVKDRSIGRIVIITAGCSGHQRTVQNTGTAYSIILRDRTDCDISGRKAIVLLRSHHARNAACIERESALRQNSNITAVGTVEDIGIIAGHGNDARTIGDLSVGGGTDGRVGYAVGNGCISGCSADNTACHDHCRICLRRNGTADTASVHNSMTFCF